MSNLLDALWLDAGPSLRRFHQPLLQCLSQEVKIAQWEYRRSLDEASTLDVAVVLLHDYLTQRDLPAVRLCQRVASPQENRPIHLIGHGMGGVIGLLYARRYPQQVRSLTLLAVAAQPAATWHAHYYVQRQLLPCSRQQVLAQTVRSLFGTSMPYPVKALIALLGRDLEDSPSPHSLFRLVNLPQDGVTVPLTVCGSKTDPIVNSPALHEWLTWLKPGDALWECPEGRHFFHYFHPKQVEGEIQNFWQSLPSTASLVNA